MKRWRSALAAVAVAGMVAVVPACGEDEEEATLPDDVQQQIDDAQEQGRELQEDIQDDVDEQLEGQQEELQNELEDAPSEDSGE